MQGDILSGVDLPAVIIPTFQKLAGRLEPTFLHTTKSSIPCLPRLHVRVSRCVALGPIVLGTRRDTVAGVVVWKLMCCEEAGVVFALPLGFYDFFLRLLFFWNFTAVLWGPL